MACGGRLRATYGARGSGDPNAGVILNDFYRSYSGGSGTYFYQLFPDGYIIQCYECTTTYGADIIYFPNAFPTGCIQVIAMDGYPASAAGAYPIICGVQQLSATYFALYTFRWNGSAWGYAVGGYTIRYLAIGY